MNLESREPKILTAAEYADKFGMGGETAVAPVLAEASGLGAEKSEAAPRIVSAKLRAALDHAKDNRKFEIDLYWKRATYFWTLIAATFAGYFAIMAADKGQPPLDEKPLLAFALACIGFVFTFAWFLVNKGSKQWQENWENHVDMLEDDVTGPLYKTVMRRPSDAAEGLLSDLITGPEPISVSKINQLVNAFTLLIWLLLGLHVSNLFAAHSSPAVSWERVAIVVVALLACVSFKRLGRTHVGSHEHVAYIRTTIVLDAETVAEHRKLHGLPPSS